MPATAVKSKWSSGNLIFTERVIGNGAQVHFGIDDDGLDVKFCGATASAYMLWDESADALVFAGLAKVDIGSSGTPLVLTAGTPIFELYSTCASTSGSTSAQPFVVQSTMTGTGGVGGRSLFRLDTNVTLGGWANALKAYVELGASGKVTGLMSSFCAELKMPNANMGSGGQYFPLEVEYVAGGTSLVTAGSGGGNLAGFAYFGNTGDPDGDFDDNGCLFRIDGLTVGSGHLFQVNTAADATHALRIIVGTTPYYIMLTNVGA